MPKIVPGGGSAPASVMPDKTPAKGAPGALVSGVSTRQIRPMVRSSTTGRMARAASTKQVKGGKDKGKKQKQGGGGDSDDEDDHVVAESIYNKGTANTATPEGKAKYSNYNAKLKENSSNVKKFDDGDDYEDDAKGEMGEKIHWSKSRKGVLIQNIEANDIQWIAKIGQGSTADVYKIKWFGNIYAGKRFRVDDKKGGLDKAEARMERETAVHSSLPKHSNILTFTGACGGERPCILMELVLGTTLHTALRRHDEKPDGSNPWPAVRALVYPWMLGMMKAVTFLQERPQVVVHRDINPTNLMLCDNMRSIKLFDFGVSKTCPKHQLEKNQCPQKDDVYCCAIILWEMNCGFSPPGGYTAHLEADFLTDGRRPDLQHVKWPELRQIIESAWRGDKDLRLDAPEVLAELEHLAVVDPSLLDGVKGGKQSRIKAMGEKASKMCTIL